MLAGLLCPAKAQDTSQNYVRTVTMLNAEGTDSLQSVQYYNGLGYPTVSAATAGGNGETAYSLTTYDALGREECRYLPVAVGFSMGYKTPEDIAGASAEANSGDRTAYSRSHYDALDRVTSVELPGRVWRDNDKRNRSEYLANTAEDKVLHYLANPNGKYTLVKPDDATNPYQYYPEGTLTKEVQKDADEKTVITFKDLLGNVILQRVLDGGKNYDTYYVYNEIGQLCYVLQPLYQKDGKKSQTAYEYRYDGRGRVVKKFLPGTGYVRYWYDNADRVVGMQDGMMRKRGLYRFTLYDIFGRVAVQGLADSLSVQGGKTLVAEYVCSGGFHDTGYSLSYDLVSKATPSSVVIEIVNYYDNYAFSKGSTANRFAVPNDTTEVSQVGSLTGSLALCGNGEYVSQVMEYDLKGNLVKTTSREIGGRTVVGTTAYTFTDNVAASVYDVDVKYGVHLSVSSTLAYNMHNDKKESAVLSVSHGSTAATSGMTYAYDRLGRLASVSRPSSSVGYAYELHGWLKNITTNSFREDLFYADCPVPSYNCYNGNIGTMKWSNSNYGQVRGYKFVYDGANRLTSAVYGERTSLDNKVNRYDEVLEYDENGNITSIQRRGLKQDGKYGKIDNLNLSYIGNQLSSVEEDAADYDYAGSFEYKAANGSRYMYNENGALVADKSRKIAYITYDLNNNPKQIYFMNGSVTKYVYSATGQKLRAVHYTAKPNISRTWGVKPANLTLAQILQADSTDYLMGGSLTMKNGRIDKYLFEGGYVQASVASATTDNFAFHYYNQDHLGNNREVVNANGVVQQVTNYYPFGAPYADNTAVENASFQQYKYNGKELDRMHGLDTYDYGARQHDPILARWDRVDPLAEDDPETSPYAYCMNNPVRFIDPNGMWSWPWERKSLISYSGNGTFTLNMSNFSASTRNTFNRMNNDPHCWKAGEIGINTEVGKIHLDSPKSYTATHKPVGVEEKQMTLNIGVRNAVSTGMPDRRFKPRSISPVSGAKGAGAMLAVDIAVTAVDQYQMLSSFWDSNALENQTQSLNDAFYAVQNNGGLIPDKYKDDANIIGAVVNYVFQGVNSTKNKDVEKIGNNILSTLGRYDKEKNQYTYYINQ